MDSLRGGRSWGESPQVESTEMDRLCGGPGANDSEAIVEGRLLGQGSHERAGGCGVDGSPMEGVMVLERASGVYWDEEWIRVPGMGTGLEQGVPCVYCRPGLWRHGYHGRGGIGLGCTADRGNREWMAIPQELGVRCSSARSAGRV